MNRTEKEVGFVVGRANYYLSKYKAKGPVTVLLKVVFFSFKLLIQNIKKEKVNSNTWYKLDEFNDLDKVSTISELTRTGSRWNIFSVSLKKDKHAYFSIDRALGIKPDLKGIWLVFFMGIGDYFYANRFLEELKKKYRNLEINAFVSKNFDRNNSPLVGKILELDPNITKVEYYDGHPSSDGYWKNYDYSDCFNKVSEDYLLCPMIYEQEPYVHSRLETLCETFGLDKPVITLPPLVHTLAASEIADDAIKQIEKVCRATNCKGVVFIQLSSRSTKSVYYQIDALIEKFVGENYFVVSAEQNSIQSNLCYTIDLKRFTINDSIYLLAKLKENFSTFCVTLVSAFWSVSSALNIPNLGIQHVYDLCLKTVLFPNIFVVSSARYECVSSSRFFLYQPQQGENEKYPSPEIMWHFFLLMRKAWEKEVPFNENPLN